MTYLDAAIARCRLPIRVEYSPDEGWVIETSGSLASTFNSEEAHWEYQMCCLDQAFKEMTDDPHP